MGRKNETFTKSRGGDLAIFNDHLFDLDGRAGV